MMFSLTSVAITFLAGYFLWRITKLIQWYLAINKICRNPNISPVGPVHWFWGNLKECSDLKHLMEVMKHIMTEKRTKLQSVRILFFSVSFNAVHPDTAKIIMKSSEPKPKAFSEPYSYLIPWLGDGLVLSNGQKWERNRKLLTPAFHFDILRPYVKIYNEVADILIERLVKLGKDGVSVDVEEPLCVAALDTVLRCALSLETGIQTDGKRHPYPVAVRRVGDLLMKRALKPLYLFDFIYRISSEGKEFYKNLELVHQIVDELTRQRRIALQNDPTLLEKKRLDFMDILLTAKDEKGVGLTDTEIRDEVNTFLFAGHDTTSTTMTWAMYCLAKYPEEQEKVFQEVHGIMGNKENIEWEGIQHMPILTMFIKETLRLWPTVHAIHRKLTKDTEIDGVLFPVGVFITVFFSLLNSNPNVWDNVDKFQPSRFSDSAEERDPYSFVPFAAGPRNCIGQNFAMNEMKVFLSKILNKYKVVLDEDHIIETSVEISLKSKYGVKVMLEPRCNTDEIF